MGPGNPGVRLEGPAYNRDGFVCEVSGCALMSFLPRGGAPGALICIPFA